MIRTWIFAGNSAINLTIDLKFCLKVTLHFFPKALLVKYESDFAKGRKDMLGWTDGQTDRLL